MFQTTAIVLKKIPFYEADNLIAVYSKDFGKIELVARGSQKITSKLSAHLEPINLIFLEFIYGQNFKVATNAQITDNFQSIKNDFHKTKLILEVFDYINKFVSYQEQDLNFWQFLLNFLNEVKRASDFNEQKSKVFKIYFLINFLKFLGFLPDFNQCSRCSKENFKRFYLISRHGLVCENCFREMRDNFEFLENEFLDIKELIFLKKISVPKIFGTIDLKNHSIFQDFSKILSSDKSFDFDKIQSVLDKFLDESML